MNLSVRIFDPSEQEYLSRILELSGRRLKLCVQKTDVATADVVFVKPDEPGASILISSCTRRGQPIVVVYGGDKGAFPWTLEKPATSKEVMHLLSDLHGRLGPDQPSANETDEVGQAGLIPVAQGGMLIDRLHSITAGQTPFAIVDERRKALILDVAGNRAFVTPQLFENKLKLIETAFRTTPEALVEVERQELEQLTEGMPYISTENFVWLVTQEAQPLLHSAAPSLNRRFRLSRWPSFTTLHHKSFHIAITGRLMKKNLSVNELHASCDAPLGELAKFYNFAYASNLLGASQSAPSLPSPHELQVAEQAPARAEKVGILGMILRRLAG